MLKQGFTQCPLCFSPLDRCAQVKVASTTSHPLYKPELPPLLVWLRCTACAHVFTQDYWTRAGEQLVFGSALDYQLPGTQQSEHLRNQWASTVSRVAGTLSETRGAEAVFGAIGSNRPIWVDIGFGNGGLLMTADEFGFSTIGVDVRLAAVERMRSLGYTAFCGDFEQFELAEPIAVLSMADVLEHLPDPHAALRKVHSLLSADGLIYISCPNSETSTWRHWEQANTNPYWGELEHYHNFSRSRLFELLDQNDFTVVDYYVSSRYYSCMEITACKRLTS
jgi:SAM-dependent methyltransferase